MVFKFPVYSALKPFDIMVEKHKIIIVIIIIVVIGNNNNNNDSGDNFNGTKLDSISPCGYSAPVCFAHNI